MIANSSILAIMMVIAFLKAGFIVVNYMNVGRLFSDDEEGH